MQLHVSVYSSEVGIVEFGLYRTCETPALSRCSHQLHLPVRSKDHLIIIISVIVRIVTIIPGRYDLIMLIIIHVADVSNHLLPGSCRVQTKLASRGIESTATRSD